MSSDPDESTGTSGLAAQFLGDYITAVADSSHVYAVWTDSGNASPWAAVDAFRAGTGPKPHVITQCPATFGEHRQLHGGREPVEGSLNPPVTVRKVQLATLIRYQIPENSC